MEIIRDIANDLARTAFTEDTTGGIRGTDKLEWDLNIKQMQKLNDNLFSSPHVLFSRWKNHETILC